MKSNSPSTVALAYRQAIEITRRDLYGIFPDRQLPKHLHEDALVPFLGFAGTRYQPGGVLLLAINPGGGKDGYYKRLPQDSELIPYILAFKASNSLEIEGRFAALSANYLKQAKTWNLWGIIQPVLDTCGKQSDEIAFANIRPFRTRNDHKPHVTPLRNAIDRITKPLIAGLEVGTVIALGKKAGDALQGHAITTNAYFVVPRTNGDSYVSADAVVVLRAIRKHAADSTMETDALQAAHSSLTLGLS